MNISTLQKGIKFEDEVATLLTLMGFEIERNQIINGTQIDIVAIKENRLDKIRYFVECTDRENIIGIPLVKEKSGILNTLEKGNYTDRVLMVTRNGYSAEAKEFERNTNNVKLLTIDDLENDLIDFSKYVNWYLYNYEHSEGIFSEGNLYKYYVDLTAFDEKDKKNYVLSEVFINWLSDSENNLLFILGDYGSGKTSFCRSFIYNHLLKKYRNKLDIKHIPILINLRDFKSTVDIKQAIVNTLSSYYGININNFMAFERFCSSGKILLFLDGFDEMADKADEQTIFNCFNQINVFAILNVKIVLTCRSNFFSSNYEIIQLLNKYSIDIPFEDEKSGKDIKISLRNQGKILKINQLDNKQIKEFIYKRFGSETEYILNKITSIHDLSDLSTRPVLLDMILKTLPELTKEGKKINSAGLYEHYTDKWTSRDNWRLTLPLEFRQKFCDTISIFMHKMNLQEIEYRNLETIINNLVSNVSKDNDQLEKFKNDLKTCSFFIRIGSSDIFRFAHQSFLEFFVARIIIKELSKGIPFKSSSLEEIISTRKSKSSASSIKFNLKNITFDSLKINHEMILPLTDQIENLINLNYVKNNVFEELYTMGKYLKLDRINSFKKMSVNQILQVHLKQKLNINYDISLLNKLSEEMGVNEEISTFAIEYLENSDISIQKFFKEINDIESIRLISDILKLNKAIEFTKRNSVFIIDFIKQKNHELVKLSFALSYLKIPEMINIEFMKNLKEYLSDISWKYLLLELSSYNNYHYILKEIYYSKASDNIEKLICIIALKLEIESNERLNTIITLLKSIISSPETDNNFIYELLSAKDLSSNIITTVLMDQIKIEKSSSKKINLLEILESFDFPNKKKYYNSILMTENDSTVKSTIKNIIKYPKGRIDKEKQKLIWKAIKKKHIFK